MNITLNIILGEVCLILAIALMAIGGRALRRHRRGKAAINTLVTSIKKRRSARAEKLAGMIKSGSQINDEDALDKANEFIKKQNKFYQDAIDLYFNRNHDLLSKLDCRLEDLLNQYQSLVTAAEGDAPSIDNAAVERLSKDITALSKELEGLRSENASLVSQLKAAEHELDKLGQEYVSAFSNPKANEPKTDAGQQPQASREEKRAGVVSTAINKGIPHGNGATVTKPLAEEAVSEIVESRTTNQMETGKGMIDDVEISTVEDSDDIEILGDLDLGELIGDQSGHTGNNRKPSENK